VLDKLYAETKQWNEEQLVQLLQNSIRLKWIQHLEAKYPVLRLVSSQRFVELEKSLQQAVQEKQQLTSELLLLRVREKVYEPIRYNRLNNAVTYRDLHHQVTKKKKSWPLRKTMAAFTEELFNLMPCWMASPESVSALFPLEQVFDLVIFDEASQCFAEHGIPAMARGKQVVVAGDSQQLQPSDLYQARWVEEQEGEPDTEVDSLLAMAERYLPGVHLLGHYRSKSSELIEFSNRYFYKSRLKMLPDLKQFITAEAAIDFVRVNGIWEHQCNVMEAGEVARLVMWWHRNHPAKEIGVITVNAPQQQLVLNTIEELFADSKLTKPTTLMVKNIENVQGDERDVIIFSIGYAPDKKGKINLHFGSLNLAGGENRLNVAVSRAREKIVVVCSVDPEQLKTDEVKNDGPRLLKEYLFYARAISQRNAAMPHENPKEYASSWYLAGKLVSDAVQQTSLPFADLLAQANATHLILTDDENYRFSLSVKAAHAYTPALLEKKGWRFARFASRNYWHSKQNMLLEIQRLLA
jgi:superfamily I DNA and/or RNA helicase